MRDTTNMRRGRLGVLLVGLMLSAATAASAMPAGNASLAPGWQAFIGCWEPIAAPVGALPVVSGALPEPATAHLVCVVPVEGTSAVDMITIVDGKIVERERVDATGTQSPTRKDDCSGTRSAAWSTVGQRLYLRSDLVCDGGLRRTSTGVISMTSMNEWVDVQSVAVGAQTAVRVLRYREARQGAAIPTEITAALGSRPFSVSAARLAATAPVSPADIVDVSRHLDADGAEVWLLEQKLAFTADAKRLVELTKAGVPESVVDVVVALSYPRRFTIDVNQREIALLPGEPRGGGSTTRSGIAGYDPMYGGWDPYYGSRYGRGYYSPYGYSQYGYGYGYGSGYGWYPGGRPVVIVVTDPTQAGPKVEGRAVKGRGYTTRTRPTAADPTPDRSRSGRSSSGSSESGSSSGGSSTGSSSGSSSSGSSSSGSSSGESTGRTAKVRPPSGTN
jgi:hypothetical protein